MMGFSDMTGFWTATIPEATRRINLDRGIADVNGGIGATNPSPYFCHLSDQWVRTTLASKRTDSAQILDGPRKDA